METEAELTTKISKAQQAYDDAVARKRQINDQIEALGRMRRHVVDASGHTDEAIKGIRKLDNLSSSWKGKRRNGYNGALEQDILPAVQRYYQKIDNLLAKIDSETERLEEELGTAQIKLKRSDREIGLLRDELTGLKFKPK